MAFPVNENYIIKAEIELGVRFPDSFRAKMMRSNGEAVKVKNDIFYLHPFYDTSDKKRIKRTCNSIVHETNTARSKYRLPKNLIIIGDNGGGDLLVYKIRDNGNLDQALHWLDHETLKLVFVANDFAELTITE